MKRYNVFWIGSSLMERDGKRFEIMSLKKVDGLPQKSYMIKYSVIASLQ
jgi:hypothetical protein